MAKPTGIRQRGRSWEAFVYDRRSRRKIRRTFTTHDEAKGWRADALSALRKGTLSSPTRVTLEQAATDWLDKAERAEILSRNRHAYKPSTIRGYRHDLESASFQISARFASPRFGAATCRRSSTDSSATASQAQKCATCSCHSKRSIDTRTRATR